MGYVTPAQIAQAKELDLLTYLQRFDPKELVHIAGNTYCTRKHDSLKISNGKWNWFSRGVGGRTALDYLVKVQGFSFTQAVETLTGDMPSLPSTAKQRQQESRVLRLPPHSPCAAHAFNYLLSRGIHEEVILFCIRAGCLYESLPYHNVVFLGRDQEGRTRYAALRGIAGDFKGEAPGSDKRYSFAINENPRAPGVHLFESAIDLLSYATLLKRKGRDWKQDALLSLGGVFKQKGAFVVPLALSQYLQDHPGTNTLYLHLDNDEAGRAAAADIMVGLGDKYTVQDRPPPCGKDVNDLLQWKLEQARRKE